MLPAMGCGGQYGTWAVQLSLGWLCVAGCSLDRIPRPSSDSLAVQSHDDGQGDGDAEPSPIDMPTPTVGPKPADPFDAAAPPLPTDVDAGVVDAMDAGLDAHTPPVQDDAGKGLHDASADGGVGPPADGSQPDDAGSSFGLSCGNVLCPGVPLPASQCCTDGSDVTGDRARQGNRCGAMREGETGCLQLEQPGLIDPSCPEVMPSGVSAPEPGCCTDQGHCGTFDSALNVGCHGNPGVEQACREEDIDWDTMCEGAGVYAWKANVDVTWGGQSGGLFDLTDDGRGIIEVVMRAVVKQVGPAGEFIGEVTPCAAELPAFRSSVLCEAYQPTFPTVIWDVDKPLRVPVNGRFQCMSPGCSLTFDPATALVGIDLAEVDGPWPSASEALTFDCAAGTGTACYPDLDADGRPGVSVTLPEGGFLPSAQDDCQRYRLRGAPLNANPLAIFDGVPRTDRLHLGIRMRLGGSVRLSPDCTGGDGLGVAEFVQSRAAGCMVEEGTGNLFQTPAGPNDPCDDAQGDFMNDNLPTYNILRVGQRPSWFLSLSDRRASRGPTYEITRLGPADREYTCAEVRAAF